MFRFFFSVDLLYKSEYCSKEEIINCFKSQIKCVIIINTIHLYYIVVSGIVEFKVEVVFFIKVFFTIIPYNIKIDSYNYKFFIFLFKYQIYLYICIEIF